MQFIRKIQKRADMETLKGLRGKKRLRYIWDYFRLPLAVAAIFLYIIVYSSYRYFTYKEPILYVALVNVNVGESLTKQLGADFLDAVELSPSRNEIHMLTGLYLTDDTENTYHEYTYASRLKILASIEGKQLDVAIMNQEAFDAFSQNGYLCRLDEFLTEKAPGLYGRAESALVKNIIILEDNAADVQLDPSIPYNATMEEHFFGLDLSHTRFIEAAGFKEPVYLGIVTNSPRMDAAVHYLEYLFDFFD